MIERPTSPRIAPATEWPPELADRIRNDRRGTVLNVTKTLAQHPTLFRRFGPFGGLLAFGGLLDGRSREIVILRVGWRARAVYEFGQHTLYGREAGLRDAEILALTEDPAGGPWTAQERNLIAMVDELCDDDCVSEATWQRLAARWSEAELVELLVLAGFYRLISGFLNSVGVQPEDETIPGWPEGVDPEAGRSPR